MKHLYSSESIARATWSLLINNPITPSAYFILQVIEGVQSIFYAILVQQALLKQISATQEASKSESSIKLSLSFFNHYDDLLTEHKDIVIMSSYALLAFYTFMLLMLIIQISITRKKDAKQLKDQRNFPKILGAALIIFNKVLYLPMIEFTFRGFLLFSKLSLGTYIAMIIINSLSVAAFLILMFYVKRIFKLCMYVPHIPWGGSDSKAVYFGFIAKMIHPILIAIDSQGSMIQITILISSLIQIIYLVTLLLFVESYNRKAEVFQKYVQGTVVLIIGIGVVKLILQDYNSQEGIIILCLLLFNTYMIYSLHKSRQSSLLKKYHQGKLKMELEYECLLVTLLEIAQETLKEGSSTSDYSFARVMDMFETHQLACFNMECICQKKEEFFTLFKEGFNQTSSVFYVQSLEFKKVKHFITGKANQWYNSSIGRLKQDIMSNQKAKKKFAAIEEDETAIDIKKSALDFKYASVTADPTKDQVEKIKIVKIDINQVKNTFVTNFILVYFNDVKKQYPNSLKIQTLCNHYSMFIAKKPQLCISQLRSFNQRGLSSLNKITKYLNESYVLHHYEQTQLEEQSNAQNGKLDGEHFITINDLYTEFHATVDSLSLESSEFWAGFQFEDIDTYRQNDLGDKIAKRLQLTYKIFKDIEDEIIQKDFKIYVWFANVQLLVMNDSEGYQMFMMKMRSVFQMNKIFQSNIKYTNIMNEDSGFIVTDGQTQTSGRLLFMNKLIQRWLHREGEEIRFLNINHTMPKLIGDKHDEFMKKFNETGDSVTLNKRVINFMLDKYGNLFPVELLIKFYYSQKYQYCFITFVNQISEITPFADGIKYQTNQVIFMTIDLYDGQIYEVSKNFLGLLKASGIFQFNSVLEISLSEHKHHIQELLKGFSLHSLAKLRSQENQSQEFYNGMHELDLSMFIDAFENGNHQQLRKDIYVKTSIYVETYGNGSLQLGFVALSLANGLGSLQLDDDNELSHHDAQIEQDNFLEHQEQIERESMGSSQNSSQSGSSKSSAHAIQQFHSFNKQTTPRILKIAINLVLLMFLVSVTVATVNLALNIQNQETSNLLIKQMRAAVDRINYSGNLRMMTRVMANIANGYEKPKSSLLENRFSNYINQVNQRINIMRENNNYLQRYSVVINEEEHNRRETEPIEIQYLMQNNKIQKENTTYRNLQSLWTSRLSQIASYNISQYRSKIDLISLTPNTSERYNPSQEEQTIFFILQNGNGPIRYYNRLYQIYYTDDTRQYADKNENQTLITTVISILTIFIVACIISPILSKTEERKFNALTFFIKIPQDQIKNFITNAQKCRNLDAVRKGAKQNSNKKSFMFSQIGLVSEMDNQNQDSRQINGSEIVTDAVEDMSRNFENSLLDYSSKRIMRSSNASIRGLAGHKDNNVKKEEQDSRSNNHQHKKTIYEDDSVAELDFSNIMKVAKRGIHKKVNPQKDSNNNLSKIMKNENVKQNQKIAEDLSDAKQYTEEFKLEQIERNIKSVKKIAFKRKAITVLIVLALMILFSVYFIASLLMAQNNYRTTFQASVDLNTIFQKELCLENLFIYIRENYIQNKSIILDGTNGEIASEVFLLRCLQQEEDYKKIRRDIPPYLKDAESFIETMESVRYCEEGYFDPTTEEKLIGACKKALNGLLSKGISNTLSYMISAAYKFNMIYQRADEDNAKSLEFIRSILIDEDFLEILDTKMYVMPDSFTKLQNTVMDSTLAYFEKLLTEFVIVYAIFMAVLVLSMSYFSIFIFKKLKISMWNTNMLLKIIPSDTLNKKDEDLLKQFFIN